MAAATSLKILSDFDGVWTDQAFEAENVKLYLIAEAARTAQIGADQAREHFADFERTVKASPARYGWAPDGRITAYVDEDPFCEANAIAMLLDELQGDATAKRYRDAVLASGFETLTKFADHCFMTATAAFRLQHPPALVPGAKEMLEGLLALGAEVVVVSNSSSEKIVGWFRQIGVDARTERGGALRVRGAAQKMTLGASDASIELSGRKIRVDRPLYRRVIEEENPDYVIGDVFSLDLALPHVLRREGHAFAPRELVLRRHPHTPAWVLDSRADGAIDHVVDSVQGLASIVRRA
jgi:FMN phosphatase YigB (HAD superfamily)